MVHLCMYMNMYMGNHVHKMYIIMYMYIHVHVHVHLYNYVSVVHYYVFIITSLLYIYMYMYMYMYIVHAQWVTSYCCLPAINSAINIYRASSTSTQQTPV